ncbi:DUF2897 family protein [Shewanella sedimentimangrovi]|uniref:DUF2897 family protein n=1 Tax=Shewanella sedimentimangrovi TaxID=2814293 RepID=A0ABX7R5K6_9GAMM|nr:DUF2897 family protein [Shewanella sedimentimangrovi]QSX39063.1 DUF2897 family protein [Shewanella sedimentimangrovi]
MSSLEVWLIILLVVGVIASNLAVLRYSAKFKLPQFGDPKKNAKEQQGQPQNEANQAAADADPQNKVSKTDSAEHNQEEKPQGPPGDKQE